MAAEIGETAVARCRHFGDCGGCAWQDVPYARQLERKRAIVAKALGRDDVRPTLGCDAPYGYRNKMEFSFGDRRWLTPAEIASGAEVDRGFALGLFVKRRFDRVLDLQECHLPPPVASRIVNAIRDLARARGWKPWNARAHSGELRHLSIRASARCPEVLVDLVTFDSNPARNAEVEALLRAEFPEVTTLVNTVHSGRAQTAHGERTDVVFGSGTLKDRLFDLTFEIGPKSFFQVNTAQAERLYALAIEAAGLRKDDLVFDLYCGVGTIALSLARHVRKVVGVELDANAIASAQRNASANGITNAEFEAGDLATALPGMVERHGSPRVVLVDPPRAGMHPKALRALIALAPQRLVYVSCNPKTLATDLQALADRYEIESVQPVDMFPQTEHVESVTAMRRNAPVTARATPQEQAEGLA